MKSIWSLALLLAMECFASAQYQDVINASGDATRTRSTAISAMKAQPLSLASENARYTYERALARCDQERASARPACRWFAKDQYDESTRPTRHDDSPQHGIRR